MIDDDVNSTIRLGVQSKILWLFIFADIKYIINNINLGTKIWHHAYQMYIYLFINKYYCNNKQFCLLMHRV